MQALRGAPQDAPYLGGLVRDLAYLLRDDKQHLQALDLLRTYQPRFPDFTDLWFTEGLLHMDLGRASDMLRCFQRCLDLGEAPARYGSVAGVGSFRADYNLGIFYELSASKEAGPKRPLAPRPSPAVSQDGDFGRAWAHYQAALRAAPDFQPARVALARLCPEAASGPA